MLPFSKAKKSPRSQNFGESEREDVLYKETTIKKVVFLYSILSRNEVKINVDGRTS
nr:MAG TPA: hypothetical protein [Caudoviricetes sp.]